jgi:hypothetical protein
MVDLFVRVAIGVLVGGLLGAALAWWTSVPEWGVGAFAGALSAVISSWALYSLRSSSRPKSEPKPERPDSSQNSSD